MQTTQTKAAADWRIVLALVRSHKDQAGIL
jgi:hypothetical protein